VAREDAALAAMEAFPDRIRHRLIEHAGKIDRQRLQRLDDEGRRFEERVLLIALRLIAHALRDLRRIAGRFEEGLRLATEELAGLARAAARLLGRADQRGRLTVVDLGDVT